MIDINKPDNDYVVCNSCYAVNKNIQIDIRRRFSGSMFSGTSGYALILCEDCANELLRKLALYKTEGKTNEADESI